MILPWPHRAHIQKERRGGPAPKKTKGYVLPKLRPLFWLTSDRILVVRVSSAPVAIRVGVVSLVIPSHIINKALLIH